MTRKRYSKYPITDLAGNVIGFSCPEKHIEIRECDKRQADMVIVPHHYSHKVTKNSCLSMLVLFHNKIRGALQMGYGIRPKIKMGGQFVAKQQESSTECGYPTKCQNTAKQ